MRGDEGMKNVTIGLTFLLVSAILYGSSLIAASNYSQVLIQGGQGWDTRYGVFGTALREVGTFPLTIATLSGILGILFIVKALRNN